MIRSPLQKNEVNPPSLPLALFAGSLIGFVSGLIGVGGGIFLSPLLIIMGWAGTKKTAAVSAVFVLLNSLSGLMGHMSATQNIPPDGLIIALAAVCGGITGAYLGSRRLPHLAIQRALSIVLIIAVCKLILI